MVYTPMKLFSDGADMAGIIKSAADIGIAGFTTNPTLMKQAGITDYEKFARRAIGYLKDTRPETCLSLEVFADDQDEMIKQARIIDSWSDNYKLYIKIPVTNSKGEFNKKVIYTLNTEGINLNITAITNQQQVEKVMKARDQDSTTPMIISLFCGRVADTGRNPSRFVENSRLIRNDWSDPYSDNIEFLWASPREIYNYQEALNAGCNIITMPPAMITKMRENSGKDLDLVSLDTVKMFYNDAIASGFSIGE